MDNVQYVPEVSRSNLLKNTLLHVPIFQVFQVLHKPSGKETRSKEKSMKTTHILILNRSSKRNDLETTKILKYNKKTWFYVIVVTLKHYQNTLT